MKNRGGSALKRSAPRVQNARRKAAKPGVVPDAEQSVIRAANRIIGRLERRIRQLERVERHAREMLDHDGSDGSLDYHAMKLFEARKALRAVLAEEQAQ